jgi:hypothetical protein
MSAWCTHVTKNSASISVGTSLLVLAAPQPYSPVDDSWAIDVVWQGGRRRIVAAPKDLMPLDWYFDWHKSARQSEETPAR